MKFELLPEETSKRKFSYVLLVLGAILVIFALVNGVSDNTPMILMSILGVLVFSIAFVHHWREIRKFQIMLFVSLISIIFFILMHNVFYGLAAKSEDIFILYSILDFLSVLFFLIVVYICPIGITIGLIGLAIIFVKKLIKRKSKDNNIEETNKDIDSEYILDESDMGMKKE